MQKFPGPQLSEYLLLHFPYLFIFYFYWNAWKMPGLDEGGGGKKRKRRKVLCNLSSCSFFVFFFPFLILNNCDYSLKLSAPPFFSMIGYYDTFSPSVFLTLPFLFAAMPLQWWNKWSISLTGDLPFCHQISPYRAHLLTWTFPWWTSVQKLLLLLIFP